MLDWHSCQICYPLQINILILLLLSIGLEIERNVFEKILKPVLLVE